jgi:hypothetical protein
MAGRSHVEQTIEPAKTLIANINVPITRTLPAIIEILTSTAWFAIY